MPADKEHRKAGRAPSSPPAVTELPLWKKVLFSAVLTGLLLLVLEVILAAAGVRPVLYDEDPYLGCSSRVPLFVEEAGGGAPAWMVTARNKRRWFNEQRFPKAKERGATRIFCVGGSTTYGRPYNDATSFCGWLRELLPVVAPGHRWDVINAGGISYASYRVAMLTEELIRYQPDVLIIYSGHNEFLERRTYARLIDMPAVLRNLVGLLSRTRLYTLGKRFLRGAPRAGPDGGTRGREQLSAEVETLLDDAVGPEAYERDDELQRHVVTHYEHNLRRVIAIARSVGAAPLLVTPACNLRDCAPFKSEATEGLSASDAEDCAQLAERATRAREEGRLAEAREALDAATSRDPRNADLQYLWGRTLDELGEFREAEEAYRRARDEDICPLRALSSLQAGVAAVARDEDVPLIDFAALLAARSPNGIPGENLFLDHVHPTIEGHRMLALAILESMAALGWVPPPRAWDRAALDARAEEVIGSLDPEAHGIAMRNLAKVLGWAGKAEEAERAARRAVSMIPNDAISHYQLGVHAQRGGDLNAAAAHYRRALATSTHYPQAHNNLGNVLVQQGEYERAREHYERAIAGDPDFAKAHNNLGLLLETLGDFEGARAHLGRAVQIDSDYAEAHANLGNLLIRTGDLSSAADHYRRALRIRPDYAKAHANLGVVLAQQGRIEEAVGHYRRAIQLAPESARARHNLALALSHLGKHEEAIEQLEESLRIDPGNAAAREDLTRLRAYLETSR